MQSLPKRAELDRLAGQYSLAEAGVETLLEVAGARPSRAAGLHFLSRMLRIGGLLSLAASVVFFVAANWSRIAVFGRFALLELVFATAIVVALLRPPPAIVGRAAMFLAFVVTGALLALVGQTYQTGADVYELFLAWALLGLPLAALAAWNLCSAAWLLVLDAALLLFCGWHPTGGLLWAVLGGARFETPQVVMAAALLNIALWCLFEFLRVNAVPQWVRRLALSCGFGFGTWAGVLAIVDRESNAGVVLVLFIAMAAVAGWAWQRRSDIYPLAVVLGTFIIVSLVWIAKVTNFENEGVLLLLSVWLIGTSTVAARLLSTTLRRWRAQSAA